MSGAPTRGRLGSSALPGRPGAMFRIDVEESSPGGATIALAGSVTGDAVDALRDALAACRARDAAVTVDLAQVTAIDRVGIELLATATAQGFRLRRANGFVQAWLRAERRRPA